MTTQVNNDTMDNNSPNVDNDNFMSLLSQAFSKNIPSVYSKPSTTQGIENIIDSLKERPPVNKMKFPREF